MYSSGVTENILVLFSRINVVLQFRNVFFICVFNGFSCLVFILVLRPLSVYGTKDSPGGHAEVR